MFQLDWRNKTLWKKESPCHPGAGPDFPQDNIRRTSLLYWSEHCVECAPPACYTTCPLYVARSDRKCARFSYGIYPNRSFEGEFDFGADIRFRRWGKLDTIIYGPSISPSRHRFWDRINRFVTRIVNLLSGVLQPLNPRRRLNGALTFFRHKLMALPGHVSTKNKYDAFLLECFVPEDQEPFRLIFEYVDANRNVRFREGFDLNRGWNLHTVPAESFNFERYPPRGRLRLFPENDIEPRIIFTFLDFVQYKQSPQELSAKKSVPKAKPSAKVKCVAWDLDNTLWKGILVEDGPDNLMVNEEALALIKKLDERGIIHTVVSKNNHDDAWAKIESIGLKDYFLYPGINWGPKSSNLKTIANKLNINIDTFALIDDSPFERAEVQSVLPQVRTYSEQQIPEILSLEEFDVPITEASKTRRESYLSQVQRDRVRESFSDNYEDFLRSCEMKMRIFVPQEEKHILRCLELIQRSNQLNLSTRRYTSEEFDQLRADSGTLCAAFECEDRFGNYGLVGFASVNEKAEKPVIKDFVLSCRVAQKRVEHTFMNWLASREAGRGHTALQADIVRTAKNEPLFQVFEDLPFEVVREENGNVLMEMSLDKKIETNNVISLQAAID